MATDEVSVIALVENLELLVPRRLPARLLHPQDRSHQQQRTQPQVTRIIELSDRDSKMALKRQLKFDLDTEDELVGKNNEASESEERESLEILRRLPPGTVLIKQMEARNLQKDEEMRTSRQEIVNEKTRKLSQRIRNKKTFDVRRNPMRSAARKDFGKEGRTTGVTTRQRLLGTRKRGGIGSESGTRRPRPTAYMNTRSVTRKMYNVGAMYEAPTRRDEIEWKEWPVHGMHERPVYHPQFGLAAEYNGRLFASFDGESYREINAEAHIEIVRVDPRVDSLDRRCDAPVSLQYTQQKPTVATATNVVRQQLSPVSLYDRPRLSSLCGFSAQTPALEQPYTNFGLTQQHQQHQLEQTRKLERLQQIENSLQRLGHRVYPPSGDGYQQKLATSRVMLRSKEILRSLRGVSLAHGHASTQANPSKCLIMPRATTTPVTLPFCGVQAVKGNPKGKLFFVRTSDAPKTSTNEKTSTITSASLSSSVSWADVSLRKKLEKSGVIAIETPRTYVGNPGKGCRQSQLVHHINRGFPSIRLASETAGVFRLNPGINSNKCNGGDFGFRNSGSEDHLSEVLDLSKKETPRSVTKMEFDPKHDHKQESQAYATDLVHYFKNFNADESIDLFEDPKNLT